MKLEVGMYVRTRYGRIYNIENIETKKVYYSCNPLEHQWQDRKFIYGERGMECTEAIKKASYNIIDLIEEGDLIKIEYYSERYEKRVTRLFEVSKYNQYLTFSNAKCEFFLSCGEFTKEDKELRPIIKSIVTKEQFEEMQYEVGE